MRASSRVCWPPLSRKAKPRRGQFNRFGQVRQRAPGATGNAGVLSTAKARLFFVLFYFKCYPLQEVMGVLFGLSQPQVCLWIGRLTPLVNAALGRELVLPARRPADLERLLAEVPALRLLILDGAERPIRRPKDKQRKKGRLQRQEEGPPQEEPAPFQSRAARRVPGANGGRQRPRQEAGG